MQTLTRSALGFAFAAAFALPAIASAQVSTQGTQECTARVTPAAINIGQPAVRLTVTLSQDVGELTSLEAAASGIAVAEARAIPRTELAAGGTAPQPIAMGAQPNTWTIWVNTADAKAGSHDIAFVAGQRSCTGEVAVTPGN